MRKANKIMMITVSVLLSAVLLTTSALSGTLAKYTTSATAHSESARVAKWGVTVEATPDPNLVAISDQKNNTKLDNGALTITFKDIAIAPGDDFSKAVHFKIEGQAEVKLQVKIIVDLSFKIEESDQNGFFVPNGIGGVDKTSAGKKGQYFIPMAFTFGANDYDGKYSSINASSSWRQAAQKTTEEVISKAIANRMDVEATTSDISRVSTYVCKTFNPGDEIFFKPKKITNSSTGAYVLNEAENRRINEFDLGFKWTTTSKNSSGTLDYDEITMYLTTEKDPVMTVMYTVLIEQVQ